MKKVLSVVLTLVMVLSLVACGTQNSESNAVETKAKTTENEEVKLEAAEETEGEAVLDKEGSGDHTIRISCIPAEVVTDYIQLVADKFKETYPDFQVDITTIPYEEYVPQAPRVLGSEENAFDMCWIQREQHWKSMADEGMFMVINDLYADGGWEKALGAGVANLYKNADGDYVGVCDDIVWVGNVFYNKAIFDEVGVDIPTSFEELTDVCEKIKAAGYIPMASAGSKHLFYTYCAGQLTNEEYDKLCDPTQAEAVWRDGKMVDVLNQFKTFSDNYLQEGNEGESIDAEACELFCQNKAAMIVGINSAVCQGSCHET